MPSKLYREGRLPYYPGSLLSWLEDETISRLVIRMDLLRMPNTFPGNERVVAMIMGCAQDDDGEVSWVLEYDATPRDAKMWITFHSDLKAQPFLFLWGVLRSQHRGWWKGRGTNIFRLGVQPWEWDDNQETDWNMLEPTSILVMQHLCRLEGMVRNWSPPDGRYADAVMVRRKTVNRLASIVRNSNHELAQLVSGFAA